MPFEMGVELFSCEAPYRLSGLQEVVGQGIGGRCLVPAEDSQEGLVVVGRQDGITTDFPG